MRKDTDRSARSAVADAWRQYEEGKAYKNRIGLYDRVRENERFYRGDQWNGVKTAGLPTPVFNVVNRVTNFLISAAAAYSVEVSLRDESLPFLPESEARRRMTDGVALLNRAIAAVWRKNRMDALIRDALRDAALCGDGVFYAYWDGDAATGQPYRGEIRCQTADSVSLFAADMNRADLQAQDYLILSGRDTVSRLTAEAIRAGVPAAVAATIRPDEETDGGAGDLSREENGDESAGKATYLIRFTRDEEGHVVFEKMTRTVRIRRVVTGLSRYPVAYFCWEPVKNSLHGASPVSGMIPNQKYINRAYAMVMKHMTDTAFSKVIYDKKLIPEWTNEVGQAIGVVSGGDISGAAMTLGVGTMNDDCLRVIDMTMENTKELMGATEAAMGEVQNPSNTSAILAVQQAAAMPLETVRASLYRCLEDLTVILAELICEYYAPGRRIAGDVENGDPADAVGDTFDFSLLRSHLLHASCRVGPAERYSQLTRIATLEKLLAGGHITARQYLERLPEDMVPDRETLIGEIGAAEREREEKEEKGKMSNE